MQQTDVFVMGSIVMPDMRMEGIPVVLMESLATELPTIATRISGIPELVIDGDTGYLAPERDPQAIADMLVEIYNDPEEGARRGRSGRQRVLDEFTIEGNVTRLRGIFEAVLD
jgi:glycosyltransferase involved in cell wall biosynthesis